MTQQLTSAQVRSVLDAIGQRIQECEERARVNAREAICHKIEIGKALMRAKQMLPHGQFAEWATSTLGWTRQHVARHIQLARHGARVLDLAGADCSMKAALRAIAPAGTRTEERWELVGVLAGDPDGSEPSDLVSLVTAWRVRRKA